MIWARAYLIKQMKNRIRYIDLAAGILILWIMTFHALNHAKVFGPTDARVALPYLVFSLPWFFYKSGQFLHSVKLSNTMHDFRKLVIPFVIWSAVGYLFYLGMMVIDGKAFTYSSCVAEPLQTFYIFGYIPINVPIWFLLSLFAAKLVSRLLLAIRLHPILIMILGFGTAFALFLWNNPAVPVYCANIPMGIGFMMLGYMLGKYEHKLWLVLLCAASFVLMLIFATPVVGLHRNVLLKGYYLLWPLFGYTGSVTMDWICRLVRGLLDGIGLTKFRPISFLGERALLLLATHALIYMPVIHYANHIHLSPLMLFLLIEALYLIILIPLVCTRRRK